MSQVLATCELAELTDTAGQLTCSTGWQYKEVLYPIYELSPADTATLMGLIAVFLTACYIGRRLLSFLDKAGTSGD